MPELIERVEDRLADFTRDKRVLTLSWMAVIVGALSAVIAYILVWLIAVITNIAFYRQFSSVFQSPDHHRLGYFVILVPVIGGLMIGLMARYGSEKIRGHGIPEALEAILFGRSRMEPKIAVLKPLSSAISIGTGGPFGAEGPIIMTGGARWARSSRNFFTSLPRNEKLCSSPAPPAAWRLSSPPPSPPPYWQSSFCSLSGGRVHLFRWQSQQPRPQRSASRFLAPDRYFPSIRTRASVAKVCSSLSSSARSPV